MKTKHSLIIFLFILLAGSLYSQNRFERWNGVFEGANKQRAIRFIVEQEVIDGNGSLGDPSFKFYEAPGLNEFGERFLTLDPSDLKYTDNGATFKLLIKGKSGVTRTFDVEFRKGADPKDDIYLINDRNTSWKTAITLKRKN
ncbi:MAG: hypothetical protein L6Q59_12765 [Ignavibacteriaceae bacterium]|nr:hypothetical protein [Ignavibacteriaceae bacterium]